MPDATAVSSAVPHGSRPVLVVAGEDDEPAIVEEARVELEIEIGRVVDVDALPLLPVDELELPSLLVAGALVQRVRTIEAHLHRSTSARDLGRIGHARVVQVRPAPRVVRLPGERGADEQDRSRISGRALHDQRHVPRVPTAPDGAPPRTCRSASPVGPGSSSDGCQGASVRPVDGSTSDPCPGSAGIPESTRRRRPPRPPYQPSRYHSTSNGVRASTRSASRSPGAAEARSR